jgi:dihydrofolate reductase
VSSRLVRDNVAEEINSLKQQSGKDLALFGSADLASTLIRHSLIDEYRILVTPFVLGTGNLMFKNIEQRIALKLLKATSWGSGIVALYYQPA